MEAKKRQICQFDSSSSSCYLHLYDHQKPQFNFKRVVADNSYSTFKHLQKTDSTHSEETLNPHPYEGEIKELMENPRFDFNFPEKEDDLSLSDSYVWVETESQLKELADALSREKVFGVDTEQHSLRSFLGFTCLIQISTHKEDYLVDTIALHDKMAILRHVFADPAICKVFHGADNDLLWLQRDFHIYVVNLFDTAKASDMLSKPHRSLAYLLETICSVATNKLLQREDWRQRPLPKEMVQYARTDAHYLLYIAKKLTAELKLQDNENSSCPDDKFHFLLETGRRSNMTCLQLYTKVVEAFPGDAAASSILSRHLMYSSGGDSSSFCDSKFQDLVRRLCVWRDLMARVHDESLRYVISDPAIVALAEKRPTTLQDVYDIVEQADVNTESLNITSLLPSPSPVVCSHLEDFHQLVNSKLVNLDDFFGAVLQNCFGQNGSCPLSVFNYALWFKYNTNGINKPIFKQNGVRKSQRVKKSSRKTPVYEHCRIYTNDGILLGYCYKRKLEWYLHQNLAEVVEEIPLAIRLLFEPKLCPENVGKDFYMHSRRNICVGCGEGDHYYRYRIVPSCYRTYFPEHLKRYQAHHDTVLVCIDCHANASAATYKYKKKIAEEFGIPLFANKVVNSKENQGLSAESSESAANNEEGGVSLCELRRAATALLHHGPRLPSKRHEELTQISAVTSALPSSSFFRMKNTIVMKYYGGREITKKDLERALLVSMPPYKRRQFERKRGLSLKRYKETVPDDKPETDKTACYAKSSIKEEIKQPCSATEADMTNHFVNPESNEVFETQNCNGDDVDDYSGEQSMLQIKSDGNLPSKRDLKFSVGHGRHGKQVVDYLLKEFGDDGIWKFCQRWRQVFIDAVHPRFLPGGWDVQHSWKGPNGDNSAHKEKK